MALEDKGRVAIPNRKNDCIDDARHVNKPCSCPPQQQGLKKDILVEILCSCCLLCVCCPIASVCCFIKLPCRICHQTLRRGWQWACCGARKRMFEEHSSFSDIDSDVTYGGMFKASSVS